MGEYIERKKAIDAIVKAVDTGFAVTAEDLVGILDDLPAADVAPVVHGRWIRTYEDCDLCHECSLCGKPALLDGNEKEVLSPWCPRCGAEMDGDKP